MKKWLIIILLINFSIAVFSQNTVYRVSKERYQEFQQSAEIFSPKNLKEAFSENVFSFEQKFKGKIFYIKGKVVSTRRSVFDEHIVRIEDDDDSWFPRGIDIVFPKHLSKSDVDELAALKKGDPLKILVVGRGTDYYVDVLTFY